jgi:hypothetical protein
VAGTQELTQLIFSFQHYHCLVLDAKKRSNQPKEFVLQLALYPGETPNCTRNMILDKLEVFVRELTKDYSLMSSQAFTYKEEDYVITIIAPEPCYEPGHRRHCEARNYVFYFIQPAYEFTYFNISITDYHDPPRLKVRKHFANRGCAY